MMTLMPSNAESALLQFSSTSVGLHLSKAIPGDSGEIGERKGGGASGMCVCGIAMFASSVL